jgi:hypothetical protein
MREILARKIDYDAVLRFDVVDFGGGEDDTVEIAIGIVESRQAFITATPDDELAFP